MRTAVTLGLPDKLGLPVTLGLPAVTLGLPDTLGLPVTLGPPAVTLGLPDRGRRSCEDGAWECGSMHQNLTGAPVWGRDWVQCADPLAVSPSFHMASSSHIHVGLMSGRNIGPAACP